MGSHQNSPTLPPTGLPPVLQTGFQSLNLGAPSTTTQGAAIDQQMLAAIIAAVQIANNQSQAPSTKVKIKEPEPYDGKGRGGEADRFILACENYFKARSSDFPSDEVRVQFALSYLTNTAQAWGDVILRDLLGSRALIASSNWKRFKKEFLAAFGDPDKEGTATRKLEDLSQGNRPATSYIADFQRLKVDVPWNEQGFMHQFRKGLRADIKDGMVYHKKPTTLEGYIELARQIDDRIWERKQEKAGDSNPHPKPQPRPQATLPQPRPQAPAPTPQAPSNAPNAFAHSQPVPIHIDASRRGKPSPEERERRRKEGLCYYCGEKGHTVAAHRPRQGVVEYYPQSFSAPSPYNPFQRAPIIAATNQGPVNRNPFMSPAPSNNSFTVSIAPQSTANSDNAQQDFSPNA
ncbi:hypothetical protein FRC01_011951, partial [Tulasnella sp. 417]